MLRFILAEISNQPSRLLQSNLQIALGLLKRWTSHAALCPVPEKYSFNFLKSWIPVWQFERHSLSQREWSGSESPRRRVSQQRGKIVDRRSYLTRSRSRPADLFPGPHHQSLPTNSSLSDTTPPPPPPRTHLPWPSFLLPPVKENWRYYYYVGILPTRPRVSQGISGAGHANYNIFLQSVSLMLPLIHFSWVYTFYDKELYKVMILENLK